MNKEIKEKITNLLEEMLESIQDREERVDNLIEKAINEPTKIHIDKKENGEACLSVNGSRLGLLLTLAGVEQTILKQLDCTADEYEFIKHHIGTREANTNE